MMPLLGAAAGAAAGALATMAVPVNDEIRSGAPLVGAGAGFIGGLILSIVTPRCEYPNPQPVRDSVRRTPPQTGH